MKRIGLSLFLLFGGMLVAEELPAIDEVLMEECVFTVDVTDVDAKIITELVTNMGKYSLIRTWANETYFKKLGRKTRYIPSTQFLGYVFEHPKLIKYMKSISKSDVKWKAFSRGIKRGLAKEASATLFDDLPAFAKHTGANEDTLRELALDGKWNDFILHLLRKL